MNALEHAKQLFVDSLTLLNEGNHTLAEAKLQQAHALAPDRLSILVNLVAAQLKLGKYQDAYKNAQLSLSIDDTQAQAWLNCGIAAVGIRLLDRAKTCLERALALDPANEDAVFRLACVNLKLRQHAAAVALFTQALAYAAYKVRALQNLIVIQGDLNQPEALAELVNTHHAVIQNDSLCNELLGFSYFNVNDLDKACHYFKQAALLAENKPNVNNPLDWPISEPRLRHDHEQLSLLQARGLATPASQQALRVLDKYKHIIQDKEQTLVGQTPAEDDALIQAVAGYHHLPAPRFSGIALGDNDFADIERTFMSSTSKLVVIDNFLSPEALLALRRYCEEATIWKRSYPNGYLGSFMASGFGSHIILEIARQLKLAMPHVVGPEPLRQAWGFKYDQRMTGINLHADFARVNINFWLTPDDACLDDTTGGLVVYDTPPPNDWSFEEANYDSPKIKAYLDAQQAKMIRVPYKMNRCILFDSTYFHATDDIHFKVGYENRRVNCTLLFGDGL